MSTETSTSWVQSRLIKIGLLGVMAALVAAAAYTSVLIMRRQAALREVSGYNVTWLVSQATLEVARLHGTIASAAVPGSAVDADDVDLRLDIVANRVQLFEGGDVASFIAASPELIAIVAEFRATMLEARREFDSGQTPAQLLSILRLVANLNPPLARLAAAANSHGGNLVAMDQQQLSNLHWTFAGLLGSITLCGLGLVAAMTWQNRLLVRAQDEGSRQNVALQVRDLELNTQNARFDAALNNMSQALCMMNGEQRLIVCNDRFLKLFGVAATAAQPGTSATELFNRIAAAGRFGGAMIATIANKQLVHAGDHKSCRLNEEDAAGRALAVSQEPMSGGGWVATYEDITERRRTEARITHMAHHDALTGLPNRVLFYERLEQALCHPDLQAQQVAILCLDLDQFKRVNDTLGHPAGDSLLKAVARRLSECVRLADLVVRLGGDEFAILQVGARQPESAEALATRVIAELSAPFDIGGHRVVIGASIGIAIASLELGQAESLLKGADIALYCAKEDGRGNYRHFESAMDTRMQEKLAIESDLRDALSRDELEIFYQPLFNLKSSQLCGFEALLRWRHPVRGLVSPATFIPVAEELGLIIPIGEWALQRACRDAASWPSELKVAVNLSPVQFRSDGLVHAVLNALVASGLRASRLELEITESALLQDSKAVLATLHELGALGLRIALDDFGTGYSSLSYLRSFPFDKLKIDQSFIREVGSRADCLAIVLSITELAHTLGMTTTAEGVETRQQLEQLQEIGCTEVQGFLFDRPRPHAQIGRWFPLGQPATISRHGVPWLHRAPESLAVSSA